MINYLIRKFDEWWLGGIDIGILESPYYTRVWMIDKNSHPIETNQ